MKQLFLTLVATSCLFASCSSVGSNKSDGQVIQATTAPEALEQAWTLVRLGEKEVTEETGGGVPTLNIDLSSQQVSGSGGCNRYFGSIVELGEGKLVFGTLGATRMACPELSLEMEYMERLSEVAAFRILQDSLQLLDTEGKTRLIYIKEELKSTQNHLDTAAAAALGQRWIATHIRGKGISVIEESQPLIEFNMEEMTLSGTDGCNALMAELLAVTDTKLELGEIAGTLRMCSEMDVADQFRAALAEVRGYQLEEHGALKLLSDRGEELIRLNLAER